MKTLALIGCGEITKMHTNDFNQMKDIVTPIAFCDLIEERAIDRANRCGGTAKVYTDYKLMLDEMKPDMVFIAVPPYCHGEIEMDLIERGIPFFVQKPMTLDLDFARKVRDLVKEKNIITAVGLQSRYSDVCAPAIEYAKTHDVVRVHAVMGGGIPRAEWWRDRKLSGGKIVETSIHQLDLMRYIMGDVDEVFAMGTEGFVGQDDFPGYDTEDAFTAILKFKNGAIATLVDGNYSKTLDSMSGTNIVFSTREGRGELPGGSVGTFEIYGEKGEDYDASNIRPYWDLNGGVEPRRNTLTRYENKSDMDLDCDRAFVEAVISGDASKIRTSYGDIFGTLALVLALRKSLDTGLPVKVENE